MAASAQRGQVSRQFVTDALIGQVVEFATLSVAGVEMAAGRAATGGGVQITRRATGGRFTVE